MSHIYNDYTAEQASLMAQTVKNLSAMLETQSSIPRWGRSPGEEKGNPLQYSYLENSMDSESWLQFMLSQRVRHSWSNSVHAHTNTHTLQSKMMTLLIICWINEWVCRVLSHWGKFKTCFFCIILDVFAVSFLSCLKEENISFIFQEGHYSSMNNLFSLPHASNGPEN